MNSKVKNIILFSIIAAIFIAITILGTIYDLQISKALADLQPGQYHSTNLFAIIGETIGENILYVLLVSSLCILFYYLHKNPLNKKWLNITLKIAILLISYAICFYCIHKTSEYVATHTTFGLDEYLSSTLGLITILLVSLTANILAFLLFSKISNENLQKLWKWALLVIVLAALSNGIVQGAKRIFDRTRYRAMFYIGDTEFQYFDYWFVFNNNKFSSISTYAEDFFKSFPSGHTCAAASSFFLICLPLFLPQTNNKKWKCIFWGFAGLYTMLVALSRIIAGAHFFMDVFVGASVTIVLTLISYFYIKYKQNKKTQLENTTMKRSKRTAC